jgi:hypothetical protein
MAATNAQAEKRRQILSNYLEALTLFEDVSRNEVVPDRPIRAPWRDRPAGHTDESTHPTAPAVDSLLKSGHREPAR